MEETLLGNAGALYKLRDRIGAEPFLLLNADAVFDVDFNRMVEYHKAHNALVTLFTHPNSHPYDSGLILADEENRGDKRGRFRYNHLSPFVPFLLNAQRMVDYKNEVHYTDDTQIDPSLLAFLRFAGASLEEMDGDFRDDYVERLQTTVHKIKSDRDMGERYMVFERLLKDEYKAGKEEGRAEGKAEGQNGFVMYFLAKLGEVPYDLKQTLSEITEEDRLYELGSIAANATSIEEFIQKSNIKS